MSATDPISAGIQAGSQVSSAPDYGDRVKAAVGNLIGGTGGGVVAAGALSSSTLAAALPFVAAAAPVAAVLLPVIGFVYGLDQAIVAIFGLDPALCYSLTIPDGSLASWGCQNTAYYLRWWRADGNPAPLMVTPTDYQNNFVGAVNWIKAGAANAGTATGMGCGQFADAFGLLQTPYTSPDGTTIPAASTILQPLQLYAAAATLAAYPTLLPIWRITIGAAFPALTDDQKNQVVAAVQPLHDAHVAIAQAWAHAQMSRPTVQQVHDRFALLPVDAQLIVDGWSLNINGHLQAPTGGVFSPTPSPDQQSPKPASLAKVATVGVVGVAGVSVLVVLWHMLHTSMGFVSSAKSVYTHAKSFFTKKPKSKRKR